MHDDIEMIGELTRGTLSHAIWVLQTTLNDAQAYLDKGEQTAALRTLRDLEHEAEHLGSVRDGIEADAYFAAHGSYL
jgi:hypothetical protein